jgi:cell wall-associated NlpC family hydrolase
MSSLKLLHILREEISEQGYGYYFRDWETSDGKTVGDVKGFDFTTNKPISSDFKNTPEDIEKMKQDMEKPDTPSEPATEGTLSANETKLVNIAKSKIGTPYLMGANGPNLFDCSGFVRWVIKQYQGNHANLPRTAHGMYRKVPSVSKSDLKPGDLFFVNTADARTGSNIDHVGMIISPKGSDKIQAIHASGSLGVNVINDLEAHKYTTKNVIAGFGRPEINF